LSERGSYVTEYVYCPECFEGLKAILFVPAEKYLTATLVTSWHPDKTLPIIAGKVGGLAAGEERFTFDVVLRPHIESALCHPLRIAVLPDSGGFELLEYNTMRVPYLKATIFPLP
jgi:hypothetical protein